MAIMIKSPPHPIDYKLYWHQFEPIRPRYKPCAFSFYWNYRMIERDFLLQHRIFV